MNACTICLDKHPLENCYTLPNCLHQFCKPCLISQFEQKIQEKKIDLSDFQCPLCTRLFSPDILEYFLPKALYNKYCEIAFEQNAIYGLEDYELLTNCLNKACKEKYVIWKDAEYSTCPACKVKFCRRCQLQYHKDEGITCEEQKLKHQDDEYNEMKRTLKFCKCPKCKTIIEKISGCNHMTCKCKTHFCFLCDTEFDFTKDRYNHFKNSGHSAGPPCRVLQDGIWVDPDKVRPKEPLDPDKVRPKEKLVQNNNLPCPNCGNLTNDISQFIIPDEYICCKSVKCKGLVYCLTCKKGMSQNELADHFSQNSTKCKFI